MDTAHLTNLLAMDASPPPPAPLQSPHSANIETHSDTHTPKSHKKPTSKASIHSTNYSEDKKSPKKPKKPAPKKPLARPASDVDINAVPNPAPDTGLSHSLYPSGIIYHGVLPVVIPTSSGALPATTSGFSPLPPLSAFATSLAATSTITHASSTQSITATPTNVDSQHQAHSTPPKHLPTAIIVLLTVGVASFLMGCYVIYRVWSRPRKHHWPTPSQPILQDDYMDERKIDPEEESLFGGKERTSARPNSDGQLLNWTQYPHVSLVKPPAALDVNASRPGSPPRRKSAELSHKTSYAFTAPGASAANTSNRATNRISMVSASVYPGSPMSGNVGLAVTGSPLTADGMPVLQRSNSKPTARRMSTAARNARQSMVVADKLHVPSTYGTSDLYGGVATPMPATPATPKLAATATSGGRARVKAPYAPASLLRTSANAPAVDESNPFEEPQYVLPPISPMVKSDDCRERDTKALTSALGLASPVPPSPQTIYPDDSITLAGDRRRSRSQFMSPTTEASARLGKLMLADLQSMASLPDAAPPPPSSSRKPALSRKRVEEKPPRVPSPPPMPSLAQMALAHNNPQDFEDYRSPTYSIYGLYEADRKSRNSGY